MADNVAITAGSGTSVAADEVVDGTLGTVKVQYVKLMDGVLDSTTKAGVSADGLKVDNSNVTTTVAAGTAPSKALVAGAVYNATQPVLTDTQSAALQSDDRGNLRTILADAVTGSGSVSSAATLFTIDTTGYLSLCIQVTSAGTSCTISYEGSNDGGTTWHGVVVQRVDSVGGSGLASLTTTGANSVILPCTHKQIRARVSSYGSGTVSATYALRTTTAISALSTIGFTSTPTVQATPNANTSTSTSATMSRIASAASTNATSVKASAGNLYSLCVTNTTVTAKFIKFYNKASSPTVGTDTPVITLAIPASGTLAMDWTLGLGFSTGIAYAITGAVADSDTTAVAANDVHGVLGYK